MSFKTLIPFLYFSFLISSYCTSVTNNLLPRANEKCNDLYLQMHSWSWRWINKEDEVMNQPPLPANFDFIIKILNPVRFTKPAELSVFTDFSELYRFTNLLLEPAIPPVPVQPVRAGFQNYAHTRNYSHTKLSILYVHPWQWLRERAWKL